MPAPSEEQGLRARLQRMALQLLEGAREDLGCCDRLGEAEVVHRIRVSMKRLRALLRLISARLPAQQHRQLQQCCRDLGRALASARDTQVALETLRALGADQQEASCWRLVQALQRDLAQERRASASTPAWPLIDQQLLELQQALQALPVKRLARRHLKRGLKDSFRAGRRDWKLVREGLADVDALAVEPLHDWRKQVKRLYYQHQLLPPAQSAAQEARRAARLKRLGELLGQLHDLDMLELRLVQLRRHYWQEDLQWLAPRLHERRQLLLREALGLGRKLYRHRDWV